MYTSKTHINISYIKDLSLIRKFPTYFRLNKKNSKSSTDPGKFIGLVIHLTDYRSPSWRNSFEKLFVLQFPFFQSSLKVCKKQLLPLWSDQINLLVDFLGKIDNERRFEFLCDLWRLYPMEQFYLSDKYDLKQLKCT